MLGRRAPDARPWRGLRGMLYRGRLADAAEGVTLVPREASSRVPRPGQRGLPEFSRVEVAPNSAEDPSRYRSGVDAGAGGRQLRHFTYNLVQYLGELGADIEVVRNDKATVDELLIRGYDRVIVSPGPVHAQRGGNLSGGRAPLPGGRHPHVGRVPGPSGACPSLGRAVTVGEPVHGKTAVDRARRTFDLPRAARAARSGALSLAGRRPRPPGRASR